MDNEDRLKAEQFNLEHEMAHDGEKRFYDQILEARSRGEESMTPAMRVIIKGGIEPISEGIEEEYKKIRSGKAYAHAAIFEQLSYFKNETIAYLALKTILDYCSRGMALNTMAIRIGRVLEDDLMISSFLKQNKPLIDKVKRNVTRRTSNYKHRRNVIKSSAQKADLVFDNWTTERRLGIGLRLIDIIITYTNLFELYEKTVNKRKAKYIVATEKTMEFVRKRHGVISLLRPLRLPMVVPPVPWTGIKDGAYLSLKFPLIRTPLGSSITDYIKMSEHEGIHFNQIYDVVNAVQETPWKINKKVLEVMQHFWYNIEEDVLGCLPKKTELDKKPYPKGGSAEDIKKWKQVSSKIYSENIRMRSHVLAFQKVLWVAEKYKDYDRVYYPHNLDFRGRIYPMPDYLTPQGDDSCKGLLQFAEGRPIKTEHGRRHFLMYGAALYGHDKLSDKNKLEWVSLNEKRILMVAKHPMEYKALWEGADKPWQYLAWCFEYRKFSESNLALLHMPIMVDGTCNGLQHLSALMKDPVGAAAVNLIDTGDTPNDIYQLVSDEANKLYDGPIKIDRKLCKRPVMTTPYGATLYGMREQVRDELKKRKNNIDNSMEYDDFDEVVKVVDAIYEGINMVVHKSRELMDWLQDIAEVVTMHNVPIEWKTPFGFYVLQTYSSFKQKRIRTQLNGVLKGYRASMREMVINKQDVRKAKNAISPNFIHSLDAAHLMLTVNDMRYEYGVKNLHIVHDCFGVHADNVDMLVHVLKENFIEMYTGEGVLDSFIEDYLKPHLDKHDYFKVVEKRPMVGSLDINKVRESRFFFS